jgi:CBS domain-containing protein
VRHGARGSYRQLLLRRELEGEKVERFMNGEPVAVPRQIAVTQLVEDYIYRHHHKMYPVVDGDRLVGVLALKDLLGFFSLRLELGDQAEA